jgi:hypothetical protein
VKLISRYTLPVITAIAITAISCSGRKNRAEHKDIIPEHDLISILTDTYLTDGLLTLPEVRYLYARGDSLSSYIDIIESYGYTKPQMDRTMRYYFVRRPKRLIKIYDKVLGNLSEMESIVDRKIPTARAGELNIWPGESVYSCPGESDISAGWIDYTIDKYARYHLKFTITVFPDDQSINPRLGLYLSHSDTTGIEKTENFSTLPYIKDGRSHTYKISLVTVLSHPVRIKGFFIKSQGSAPWLEQHYMAENIILSPYIMQE